MKNFFYCCAAIVILCFISIPFLATSKIAAGAQLDVAFPKSVPPGVLLLLLTETVADVIKNVNSNDYATDDEIVTDSYDRKIALTKMMIVFKSRATPLQFENLLDSLNATVVSSVARTRSVVVRIPQPDNLAAYFELIDQIEAEPFVDFVWKGEIPKLNALPSNYQSDPPNPTELIHIDNHLAIRAHAAWNASAAIDANYQPRVVVADSFGFGKPYNDTINYSLPYDNFRPLGDFDGGHGYAMLGIIAGNHKQYYTTGIYPEKISLGVVDHPNDTTPNTNWLTFGEIMNDLLIVLTQTQGMIVVNTSIGYACDGTGGDCIDIAHARLMASLWIEYVRLYDLEDRVLHVTAASNIEDIPGYTGPVVRDARTASPFAAAARLSGLTDGFGLPMANLTNTIVVENAVNTQDEPFTPKCLYTNSFIGGNLAGIGTNVTSFDLPTGNEIPDYTGTSCSTSQVAGLAAYLWSIDHTLFPQQIKNLLIATSESVSVVSDPECSDWGAPAPIVDAYEALLALDAADVPTVSNSPVRFSVLDVDGDGSFDQDDLQSMVNTYFDLSGAEPVLIEPTVPDYGRKDLNGDGWTGGSTTKEFDLDRSGSVQYGMTNISNVTQNINGTTVGFNETTVKDTDILCYYAYSALYTGDNTERQNLLEGICQPTDITCNYTFDVNLEMYIKNCPNEDPPVRFGHRREYVGTSSVTVHGSDSIFKEATINNIKVYTSWRIIYDTTFMFCYPSIPTGWFVISDHDFNGDNEGIAAGPSTLFPTSYTLNDVTTTCYPDYQWYPYKDCGEYNCPDGALNIQPTLDFPGDCHQWWDHYDSEGNWVECTF